MLLGGNRVEEDVVQGVHYVDYTETWHPIHHSVILRVLENATRAVGLDIVQREYSLSKDGADMFGVWSISGNNSLRNWALGFRNSMKKSFAFGGSAGNRVLVCDNMCFSGDIVSHRRHTGGLSREKMQEIAHNLVGYIVEKCDSFDTWFEDLSQIEIVNHYDSVVLEALRSGVLQSKQLKSFEAYYLEEIKENKSPGTLADFHGGMTRTFRDLSLFQVQERSEPLNKYCENVIEVVSQDNPYISRFLKDE